MKYKTRASDIIGVLVLSVICGLVAFYVTGFLLDK